MQEDFFFTQQLAYILSASAAASIPQKQGHFGHWAPMQHKQITALLQGIKSIQRKQKEINVCTRTRAFRESAKESKNVGMMWSIVGLRLVGVSER